jgi:hypothetical protein
MSRAKVASDSAAARAAADAAERLDRAAATGRQLDLLAAPASPADPAELERAAAQGGAGAAGRGRPKGSANKRASHLRRVLAVRGYRMPEDVLAETAGLTDRSGRSLIELAMARAEQMLAWSHGPRATVKPAERLTALLAAMREQRQAADALLPYGLAKMTPDTTVNIAAAQILMPGAAAQGAPGDGARVIDGRAASNFAPPPLPGQTEQYQEVGATDQGTPDGGSRTK